MIDASVTYTLLFISLYFEVFLLVSFLERRSNKVALSEPLSRFPTVAIVVPCYNEAKTLAGTLTSILALGYPKEKLDIIIVDDGSTDQTLEIARQFEGLREDGLRLRVFHKENGGKHSAMNFALKRTHAELIGCLDADSEVESQALHHIARVFEDTRVAAVIPGIHVKNPQTMLQHMQHVEYRLSIFNRFMWAALGSTFITPGTFSIFRTETVRTLGGWRHGHSTEDMEMALRVQAAGHLIANVPKAVVHTSTPRNIRSLFRQRVRWTYGWLRNAVDYRHMFGNRAYGNLGMLFLPSGIILIFAGVYFFARIMFFSTQYVIDLFSRAYVTGTMPQPSFDLFYFDTSTMWFLIYMSAALVFALICAGTAIGTNQKLPPRATPLFFLFYAFLVPLWLGTAVVRATLKTGVRWR